MNRQLSGVYYVGSQIAEVSPWYILNGKLQRLSKAFKQTHRRRTVAVSTGDCGALDLPDNAVDYVFTDPPFGENIYYADLNYLVESWHRVRTASGPEAIIDRAKGKDLTDYLHAMQRCFAEYRRVLKPGRWMTVVFHNSRNAVWNAIQEAILAAGFVVADVRTLDKRQGSYRQVTSTAVKQDLVISAYKPNYGLEARFEAGSRHRGGRLGFRPHSPAAASGVRSQRRPRRSDRRAPELPAVSIAWSPFHVQRGVLVPLATAEFHAGLTTRFPERDGMFFLPEQVARVRPPAAEGEGARPTDPVRRRRGERDPVAAASAHREAADVPGGTPPLRPGVARLAEARANAGTVGTARAELPTLRRLSAMFPARSTATCRPTSRICATWTRTIRPSAPRPGTAGTCPTHARQATWRSCANAPCCENSMTIATPPSAACGCSALEAVRAGFRRAWQRQDYATIITVAQKIPDAVLQEDPKLLMWYDQAVTRSGQN